MGDDGGFERHHRLLGAERFFTAGEIEMCFFQASRSAPLFAWAQRFRTAEIGANFNWSRAFFFCLDR